MSGAVASPVHPAGRTTLLHWLSTTDHKRIGLLYLVTSFGFFLVAGAFALLIRLELAAPGLQVVDEQTYSQLFTMHGTLMMFLFGTPVVAALANYLVPLQVGAADMVFPRLNALSYWLYLFGGIIVLSGFLVAGGAADIGWTGYPPNSELRYSSTTGTDLWIVGLLLAGISSVLGAVNFIATIYGRRAPGMSMLRMPVFTWTILVTSILILFAFPALTGALAMLLLDRRFGAAFFDPGAGGSPVLWQHLFWFFGHPEVYILALPFFGIVSEVVPVFSRKPLFGYRAFVAATILIGAYSMSVWAHHMFTTGAVNNAFFSISSFAIAVPTGIKVFNWVATMFRGRLTFPTPMLFATGFIYLFVLGGITGVIVASPPLDFQFQDTYFVVAHLHNVLVGGSVFALFAGLYFWFPKLSGRRLSERLGRIHFWSWVAGFLLTFLPQYQLGASGMPRRYADYPPYPGWVELNLLSTAGAVLMAVGVVSFLVAVAGALRREADQPADPWGANSLEWWTSSPPPEHDFVSIPAIRSERPVRDAREGRP
ncbi:MAG TPA: cytochrome c oxidase subunit I [Candidatus Limnocylindrales bacterium]|jgi:cytochrome c oxidase subunit 1